jgi:hypothetical protein
MKEPNMPRGYGGKQWVKGQCGNPKGVSYEARMLGTISKLTSRQAQDIGMLLFSAKYSDLTDLLQNEDPCNYSRVIAVLLKKAIDDGDVRIFQSLCDRLMGKPRESVAVAMDASGKPVEERMQSAEEKLERIVALRRAREAIEA